MSTRLILETMMIGAIILLLVVLWFTRKDDQFQGFANFSEAVFHSLAAVGIAIAGLWVIFQQDWAPKTSIELTPSVYKIANSDPEAAIIQVAVSMKNEGRVPQYFSDVYFRARSYDASSLSADDYGDLAQENIDEYRNDKDQIRVMPGETDYTYAELRVPCAVSLVQIFVDIAEPKHLTVGADKPLSYERKLVVPITEACSIERA